MTTFFFAHTGFASDAMDAANEAIQASRRLAKVKASEAVQQDFNYALTSVMNELLKDQDFKKVRDMLLQGQKDLEKSFEQIASMDVSKATNLKAELQTVFEKYQDQVRSRYDLSYIPVQARDEVRQSIAMASRSLAYFENNCTRGKGIGGLGIKAFDYPNLPSPQYSISIRYGNNGDSGFDGSYTGTGSQSERDRNTAVNVATSAASITTSIAVSGQAGAVVAACQAAAPFMWAGAGVIAIAALYMSQEEKIKAENEIVEAQLHAFHNTADDRTVADFYKEECQSMSTRVSKIRTVLDVAYYSPEKLKSLSEAIPDLDAEMEKYKKILLERQEIIDAFNAAIKERDAASGEAKQTAIKKAQDIVVQLKKKDEELKNASSEERVGQLMLAFLVNKESVMQEQIGNLSFQAADLAQKRAFQSLLNLVSLVQKENFNKFLGNGSSISVELQNLEKFLKVKRLFQDTLTLQIRYIFGRSNNEDVKTSERQLKIQTLSLVKSHGKNPDVIAFARQVKSLVGDL